MELRHRAHARGVPPRRRRGRARPGRPGGHQPAQRRRARGRHHRPRGEIVGVAGITGSGREELAGMIFGGQWRDGEVKIDGHHLHRSRPDLSMAYGMGLVPAERHANAAFMASTLRENVTLVEPGRHYRGWVLRQRSERTDVSAWLEKLRRAPQQHRVQHVAALGRQPAEGRPRHAGCARSPRCWCSMSQRRASTSGRRPTSTGSSTKRRRWAPESSRHVHRPRGLVRICHRVLVLPRDASSTRSSDRRLSDTITAADGGRRDGVAGQARCRGSRRRRGPCAGRARGGRGARAPRGRWR